MYCLRIIPMEFDRHHADGIGQLVLAAFQGKYEWADLLEALSENDIQPYLLHSDAEGFPSEGYFSASSVMRFLHDSYFQPVLCLTPRMVVHDGTGRILNGVSERLNPFQPPTAHAVVSSYLPELSAQNPSETHVRRNARIAVHELGHLSGLSEHSTELAYTRNGLLCPMTIAHRQGHDVASRIAYIDARDTDFCDSCYQKLGTRGVSSLLFGHSSK